jgi:hypothetical protein
VDERFELTLDVRAQIAGLEDGARVTLDSADD